MSSLDTPRRSRLRAAFNLTLMLAALCGGVAALAALAGCDNNSLVTVRREAGEPSRIVGTEMRTQAVSIAPITSAGASASGLAFSGDRFDVTCSLSGGAVVFYAAAHDGTAWQIFQSNPCNLDSTTAAKGACSFAAKRASNLVWNVLKTGAGTASSCTAEGAYGPVTRNASSSGLTNVTVSSPLTGTGTAGDPVALGTVPASTGGTGQSTYAVGDLLVGAAGNTLTKLAIGASGRALVSNGTTAAWTAINTLPAAGTAGRILYDDGSTWTSLAAGTAGQVLRSGGAGAPSWAFPALLSYPVNSASGITYTASSTTPLYFSHSGAASFGGNCTPLYATLGTLRPTKIAAVRILLVNSLTGAGSIRYGLYDCDSAAYVSGASVDYVVGSATTINLTPGTTLTADHSYGFQIVGLAAGGTARLNYFSLHFE